MTTFATVEDLFLYSQDLSNCTTKTGIKRQRNRFLYSQDLSNCTTTVWDTIKAVVFLYSQDLSNCTTNSAALLTAARFCTLKI